MKSSYSRLLIWLHCIYRPTSNLIIQIFSQHLFLFSFKIYHHHHHLYPVLLIDLLTQCDTEDFTFLAVCERYFSHSDTQGRCFSEHSSNCRTAHTEKICCAYFTNLRHNMKAITIKYYLLGERKIIFSLREIIFSTRLKYNFSHSHQH